MKVLFVGEGPHDIGSSVFPPQPRPATGTIPALARKVCPQIDAESVAISWREIPILDRRKVPPLDRKALKNVWTAKTARAIVLSHTRFQCAGTICVADRDGEKERLGALEEGKERGLKLIATQHAVACGVAVESIEAWILGVPEAIADVLHESVAPILSQYDLSKVEDYYQKSGRPEHRPKDILDRIAARKNRSASTEFRRDVAERTDVNALERVCKQGFKPFAGQLRAAFGT